MKALAGDLGGGAGPAPDPGRARLEELRYLLFGCAAPAALFGLLGWFNLVRLFHQTRPDSVAGFVTGPFERALYLAFVSIPVLIYITRPRARRRAGGPAQRVAAFVGTTMLLVFPAFFDQGRRLLTPPAAVHGLADSLLVACTAFGVFSLLYLRHNFSIIPEARGFVTTGPYRLVRHPLYFAEIGVSIALAFHGDLSTWSTLLLVPFVSIQLVRSVYEERLLRATFPGYEAYAARTRRLIPFVL